MILRPDAERPMKFPIGLFDRNIIDARFSPTHAAGFIELPLQRNKAIASKGFPIISNGQTMKFILLMEPVSHVRE